MPAPTPIQLRGRSWLLPGPTNLGLVEREGGVLLVDSGNDKEAGRGVLKVLRDRAWTLKAIVNTHSNADHIGGNRYLQETTNCEIWATRGEAAFIETPELEGALLWGGFPYKELEGKFFRAQPSKVTTTIEPGSSRDGLTFVPLRGHFFDMVGVLTDDGVFYLGDGLFGERILAKHPLPYLYDVRAFREGLARIAATEAALYVPSHGEPVEDVHPLVAANLRRVDELEACLSGLLASPSSFEDLLAGLCAAFGVALDPGQYVLAGNTVRSLLSYLRAEGRADFRFEAGRMVWEGAVAGQGNQG